MRKLIGPPLDAAGRRLARAGISADVVTLTGFVIGLAAVPLLAAEYYAAALVPILANRMFDGLDGAIARQMGPTDYGGFLDIVCDFIFYSAVVLGFALARPQANAVAAIFVVFGFVGTGTSFLAYFHPRRQTRHIDRAARRQGVLLFGGADGGYRDHRLLRGDVPAARSFRLACAGVRRAVLAHDGLACPGRASDI